MAWLYVVLFHRYFMLIDSVWQDRYREFLISTREFFYLTLCKRKGAEPKREMDYASLATLCPSCPQPGINMDPNWQTRQQNMK